MDRLKTKQRKHPAIVAFAVRPCLHTVVAREVLVHVGRVWPDGLEPVGFVQQALHHAAAGHCRGLLHHYAAATTVTNPHHYSRHHIQIMDTHEDKGRDRSKWVKGQTVTIKIIITLTHNHCRGLLDYPCEAAITLTATTTNRRQRQHNHGHTHEERGGVEVGVGGRGGQPPRSHRNEGHKHQGMQTHISTTMALADSFSSDYTVQRRQNQSVYCNGWQQYTVSPLSYISRNAFSGFPYCNMACFLDARKVKITGEYTGRVNQ